jgi:hypothetical protein
MPSYITKKTFDLEFCATGTAKVVNLKENPPNRIL